MKCRPDRETYPSRLSFASAYSGVSNCQNPSVSLSIRPLPNCLLRQEDRFPPHQRISRTVGTIRDEFVESETRRADMIANIAPEILDMIVLSVMRNAVLRCSLIARILIGLGPRLDNREHQDRKTARAKYPIHLPQLLSLIPMFQNMAANSDIK